jgi:flavin reductase (DIM6/NTAB) family NADH-FMN oxidoreductase RutF
MRHYPSGVTVVTARVPAGGLVGLTATSFTSVSLDPPLILVCVDVDSSSHAPLVAAPVFCVNILSSGQAVLAARFSAQPGASRFEGVAWHAGPAGSPVLENATAWVECAMERVHEGGDHTIVLGRVLGTGATGGEALAFYRGTFRSMTP